MARPPQTMIGNDIRRRSYSISQDLPFEMEQTRGRMEAAADSAPEKCTMYNKEQCRPSGRTDGRTEGTAVAKWFVS